MGRYLPLPPLSPSMGYNFGCMIASVMLFDSRGGFSGSHYLKKTNCLRDAPLQPFLAFCIWGAHRRHLANTTEPSLWRQGSLMSNYFDHLFPDFQGFESPTNETRSLKILGSGFLLQCA